MKKVTRGGSRAIQRKGSLCMKLLRLWLWWVGGGTIVVMLLGYWKTEKQYFLMESGVRRHLKVRNSELQQNRAADLGSIKEALKQVKAFFGLYALF